MALTPEQKAMLRTVVSAAAEDPAKVARAVQHQAVRLSDPAKGYSLRNTLLLLEQWDERGSTVPLTLCAGFREWQEFGRCVKKGEPGLYITAYNGGTTEEGDGGEDKARCAFFGGTYVWDVSQTETIAERDAAKQGAA